MSKPNKVPKWMQGIRKPPKDHPALQPGAVTLVEIQHDYHCQQFNGGTCNCKPNLILKTKH